MSSHDCDSGGGVTWDGPYVRTICNACFFKRWNPEFHPRIVLFYFLYGDFKNQVLLYSWQFQPSFSKYANVKLDNETPK